MAWERELLCHPNLDLTGTACYREAVRAIVFWGGQLLMIHSQVDGDYKFPGGGLVPGETHPQALLRELAEEAGARLVGIEGKAGQVMEYDLSSDDQHDFFKMLSIYYNCRIDLQLGPTHLDPYELELGYIPVWVSLESALQTNRAVLQSRRPPRWTRRETLVLEILAVQRGRQSANDL